MKDHLIEQVIGLPLGVLQPTVKIIGPAELMECLRSHNRPDILDVRGVRYSLYHIPNSQQFDWRDWTEERATLKNAFFGHPEKWGKLLDSESSRFDVEARLQKLGLGNDRPIVILGNACKGWGEEGRAAWNLLTWGARNVSLLDGGIQAWREAGGRIGRRHSWSKKMPENQRQHGQFSVKLVEARRSSSGDLASRLMSTPNGEHAIFDARSPAEFSGQKSFGLKRAGAVPGAKLVSFASLFDSNGLFISAEKLYKLIGSSLLYLPLTYCTGGVRSALLAMLIEARLGVVCANYDGSMLKWSRKAELPVAVQQQPR